MSKEEFFIKQFQSKYIGDDAAVLKDKRVIASDSFFENIHFKREWFSLYDLAVKASLVNVSDLVVMNAKIDYAILNVGFPKSFSMQEIKDFSQGFIDIAKRFNYEIIGGDTIQNDKIAISLTLIGKSNSPISRKAKIGEYVAFTGNLGSVQKDLNRLLRGFKVSKHSKFIRPIIRDKFFYKIAKYVTSAIDISDGLFKELERISKISNIGFEFFSNFDKRVGCSGEEYEILFTFHPKYLQVIKNLSYITKTPITIFAKTKRGKFKSICKENHF